MSSSEYAASRQEAFGMALAQRVQENLRIGGRDPRQAPGGPAGTYPLAGHGDGGPRSRRRAIVARLADLEMRLDRLASRIERLDARVAETRDDVGGVSRTRSHGGRRSWRWYQPSSWPGLASRRIGNDPAGMAFGPLARSRPCRKGFRRLAPPYRAGRSLVPGFALFDSRYVVDNITQ